MIFIVSIGLNVLGNEPPEQLLDTINALGEFLFKTRGKLLQVKVFMSEYQGVPERTVQARFETFEVSRLVNDVCVLANELDQECIAVISDQGWKWRLCYANGAHNLGASVDEFPISVGDFPVVV